jgi:hypothetical protein
MGQHKPELLNANDVLSFYDLQSCPPFDITVGISGKGEVCVNWMETDNEVGGREYLDNFLQHITANVNNVNIYTLVCYDPKAVAKDTEFKHKKTWESKSIRFQLNQSNSNFYTQTMQPQIVKTVGSSATHDREIVIGEREFVKTEIERLRQLVADQDREIRQLMKECHDLQMELLQAHNTIEQLENDEEPEPTPTEKIIGKIGNILERDDVQAAIPYVINGLMDRLFPPKPAPVPQAQPRPKTVINGIKKKKSNGGSATTRNNG